MALPGSTKNRFWELNDSMMKIFQAGKKHCFLGSAWPRQNGGLMVMNPMVQSVKNHKQKQIQGLNKKGEKQETQLFNHFFKKNWDSKSIPPKFEKASPPKKKLYRRRFGGPHIHPPHMPGGFSKKPMSFPTFRHRSWKTFGILVDPKKN